MNINEMHEFFVTLKNEGQAVYFAPEEIDRALNAASDDKFNEFKQEFERTSRIADEMRNFKTSATINLTSGAGDLPANYRYRTNARTATNKIVTIVPDSEFVALLDDPIDAPDTDHPVMRIIEGVEVRPTTLASVVLYYLKSPATMVFGYTTDGDGNNVYNAGTSTDCNWPVDSHTDILRRACKYLGIPLGDQALVTLESFTKQTERA
jgi:hypothetical protein